MFVLAILLLITPISAIIRDISKDCVDVDEYYHVPDDVDPPVQCDDVDERGNCEKGWKSFERPSGEWCVKNFYHSEVLFHNDAEKKCQEHGATLSGLQDQLEAHWIADDVIRHNAPNRTYVMIGLRRIPECEKVGRTPNCTAMNSFEWTDKSATGTAGIVWSPAQPDNAYGRTQHCAVLIASNTGYQESSAYLASTMDDVICQKTAGWNKPWVTNTYVCGKKP